LAREKEELTRSIELKNTQHALAIKEAKAVQATKEKDLKTLKGQHEKLKEELKAYKKKIDDAKAVPTEEQIIKDIEIELKELQVKYNENLDAFKELKKKFGKLEEKEKEHLISIDVLKSKDVEQRNLQELTISEKKIE